MRESEERYRTTAAQLSNVLDSSLDLICSFDIDGRFLRVNAACLAMLGYTVEEMLGSLYLSKVLPEDLAKTRAGGSRRHRRALDAQLREPLPTQGRWDLRHPVGRALVR